MSDNKQLNQEQLEQVSGGSGSQRYDLCDKVVYGQKISIYDTEKPEVLNKEIIVQKRDEGPSYYYAGTLLKSWEQYNDWGRSFRLISMLVKYGTDGKNEGNTVTIKMIKEGTQSTFVWLVDHYI